MKKLVIALAAAAALTSPALAADMAAKAPLRAAPVAYAPTWTGCYVGGGGGYGLFDIETQQVNVPPGLPINRSEIKVVEAGSERFRQAATINSRSGRTSSFSAPSATTISLI